MYYSTLALKTGTSYFQYSYYINLAFLLALCSPESLLIL